MSNVLNDCITNWPFFQNLNAQLTGIPPDYLISFWTDQLKKGQINQLTDLKSDLQADHVIN